MVAELALRMLLLTALVCSLAPHRAGSGSVKRLRWSAAAAAVAVAVQADPIGFGLARADGLLLGSVCATALPR